MSLFSRSASSEPSYNGIKPVLRHDRYYISSGDVIFRVENHLFRVHRYFFVRESVVFRDMLSMPCPPGNEVEGASDANPIFLPDVKSTDFSHFLWVFYNPKYSIYEADLDAWTSVLSLAHRWQFDEVKELAVTKLEGIRISPVTKAVLARQYSIDRGWAEAAYAALGARAEPLTCEEGEQLGIKVALQIAEVRERIHERRHDDRFHDRFGGRAVSEAMSIRSRSVSPVIRPAPLLEYTARDMDDVMAVFALNQPQ